MSGGVFSKIKDYFQKNSIFFFKIGPRSLRKSARKNIICFVFQVEKFPEVCANLRTGKIKK